MPPKRRSPGDGSVSTKPRSDGLWVATIEAGFTSSGTRRRIRLYAKTKREVERKLKAKLREISEHGTPAEGVSDRDNVMVWAKKWLDITSHEVRPMTWKTNAGCINKWVIPTIGHKRIVALTPGDIRAVAEAQRRADLAASSVLRTHAVMMTMFKRALEENHRIDARILAMRRPSKNESDRSEIPMDDALAIVRAAGQLPDGSRWLMQLLQGVRQSEALGLTWDRVDLEQNTVDISWQLQALPYLDRAAGKFQVPDGFEAVQLHKALHLTRPKTEKGKRVIPLIPPMAAALRAWKAEAPSNPHGLVWARIDIGRATGQPRTPHYDNAQWLKLQETAGVRHATGRHYGTHELRHTAATMLRPFASDETIKSILGHASILTSQAYLHSNQEQARAALELVGERLQLG